MIESPLFIISELSMFVLFLINSFRKSKVSFIIALMIVISLMIALGKQI